MEKRREEEREITIIRAIGVSIFSQGHIYNWKKELGKRK